MEMSDNVSVLVGAVVGLATLLFVICQRRKWRENSSIVDLRLLRRLEDDLELKKRLLRDRLLLRVSMGLLLAILLIDGIGYLITGQTDAMPLVLVLSGLCFIAFYSVKTLRAVEQLKENRRGGAN